MPTSLCRYCYVIMAFALTGAAATASPATPATGWPIILIVSLYAP